MPEEPNRLRAAQTPPRLDALVPNELVNLNGFFHWGITAGDLKATCKELTESLGLTWAEPQRRQFRLKQPEGRCDVDFYITYSLEGPPHYEVIEATPGCIWDPSTASGIHHIGFWSEDLRGDSASLETAGFPCAATYDTPDGKPLGFTYHRLEQTGLLVELVDAERREAFENWMAGGEFPTLQAPSPGISDR